MILQNPQLRSQPALDDDVGTAIAVKIGNCESAGIVGGIEPGNARDIVVAIPTTCMHYVRLVPVPVRILTDELIDRIPTVFISRRRLGLLRRVSNNLAPEEAHQISLRMVR